jgi:Uma2 family endonuclease
MSAIPKSKNFISPEEYLQNERLASFRSEYYQGEVFAMAGASFKHTKIVKNFTVLLDNLLKKKGKGCEPFSNDLRIHIPSISLYTYPDIVVVCNEPLFIDNEFDTLLNPNILIEILSESTKKYDMGEKFHLYKQIQSLQYYVLISTTDYQVNVFSKKSENLWEILTINNLDEILKFELLEIELPVRRIYDNVPF